MLRVIRLTVLLQIGLQSGNEFSFVSLGVKTSGLALLPQFSKLKQEKHTFNATSTIYPPFSVVYSQLLFFRDNFTMFLGSSVVLTFLSVIFNALSSRIEILFIVLH